MKKKPTKQNNPTPTVKQLTEQQLEQVVGGNIPKQPTNTGGDCE